MEGSEPMDLFDPVPVVPVDPDDQVDPVDPADPADPVVTQLYQLPYKKYDDLPRYKIFLPNGRSCASCAPCASRRKDSLTRKLESCGITVVGANSKEEYPGCSYDDNPIPDVNVPYIRLTKDKYYNDISFPQKKTEIEREILLLLTGILGGSKITCSSHVSSSESSSMNQSLNLASMGESMRFTSFNSGRDSIQRDELYENTGGPAIINSKTWEEVTQNIRDQFSLIDEHSIISYDYFLRSSDLYTFAYKRFLLRLNNYVYRIEEDRTLEKSAQARVILEGYGLSTQLDSRYTISKTHEYVIEFYDFSAMKDFYAIEELQCKYEDERSRDSFARLRREYEINMKIMKKYWPDWKGDEKPIFVECIKHAKKIGIYDTLKEWMQQDGNDLNHHCHLFKSRTDVYVWFQSVLNVDIDSDMY